jgi:SNF2 family DNA or RNA helicase
MAKRAFAELNPTGDRVEVHFRYDPDLVRSIKEVPGASFVPRDSGGPHWSVPLDLTTGRRLREEFGNDLVLGRAYRVWGAEAVKREDNLHKLAGRDDFPMKEMELYAKLPKLAEWLRGYQRADIKFLSETSALNLSEQRLGKTPETIGALFEAGLEHGPHLVCCPKTAIDTVWRFEIERWTAELERPHEVISYHGDLPKSQRAAAIDEFWNCMDDDWPVWFICTYTAVREGEEPDVEWASFTIDEYHRSGLPNAGGKRGTGSKFSNSVRDVKAERRYALSGTPMGGKPIKLWGGLHFLYPEQFRSKWNWAKAWLIIDQVYGGHKQIGEVQAGREDEFYTSLAPYALRRLRSEVLPQLPPAQWIDVEYDMTAKQAKQYKDMANKAETLIEEENLTALGILAEYTRLKVFADSYCDHMQEYTIKCELCDGGGKSKGFSPDDPLAPPCPKCGGAGRLQKFKPIPAPDESGIWPVLMDKLAEQGIVPNDMEGEGLAIVSSQFEEIVKVAHAYLNNKGIPAEILVGATDKAARDATQMHFRMDGKRGPDSPRVVCMTTTLGVGITLDLVENVHILDETWVPDDQEQLADRAVNTSRMHQVGVYVYRAKGTVEQYIQETNIDKRKINKDILDIRRNGFRATMAAKHG